MRLGWYSRLVIVLMGFWTVGNATYQNRQDYWIGIEAQARYIGQCLDFEAKGIELSGKEKGEDCNAYASRQLPWLFGWASFSNHLARSAFQALVGGLLSIILYWAARWVLAGHSRPFQKI